MFLPTILATLFVFTAVIALNKLAGISNGRIVHIISVDDVYATPAEAEKNLKKEYWETPPPPSPESVIAMQAAARAANAASRPYLAEEPPAPVPASHVEPPVKVRIEPGALPMPEVKIDTSVGEPVTP